MAQGIRMMGKAGFDGNTGGAGGGSGFAGMGGGFDFLSFADKLGDINQKAYNQEANTSFSAVADPAGFNLQNVQKTVNFVNKMKQQKRNNAFQDTQKKLLESQTVGQNLQNKEVERKQKWNRDLMKYLYSGRM